MKASDSPVTRVESEDALVFEVGASPLDRFKHFAEHLFPNPRDRAGIAIALFAQCCGVQGLSPSETIEQARKALGQLSFLWKSAKP